MRAYATIKKGARQGAFVILPTPAERLFLGWSLNVFDFRRTALVFLGAATDSFFDTCSFSSSLAEVIELGSSYVTTSLNFDLLEARRVKREHTLDADSLEHAANGDGLANATASVLDDYAFITLSALFATLNDFHEDFDGIADMEVGQIAAFFDVLFFNITNNLVHGFLPVSPQKTEGLYAKRSTILSRRYRLVGTEQSIPLHLLHKF